MKLIWIFLTSLFLMQDASARSITYPGGWAVMPMHDGEMDRLHAFYTVNPNLAIGPAVEFHRQDEWVHGGIQAVYLLNRWNGEGSQGNLYVKGIAGLANRDDKTNLYGETGIQADWETRRYYTAYENTFSYAGDIETEYRELARIGIAPYVADYGSLHTWLMLQVDHRPEEEHTFEYTPFVRLFKGYTLGELGISNRGNVMANLMLQF